VVSPPAPLPVAGPSSASGPGTRLALAGILTAALGLRLWGIGYGLPWLFYFHDEPQIVLRALRFGTGDLNPHFFVWPATLLLHLAFLAYGVLFVTGRVLGWWTGAEGFAGAYFTDPTPFYLLPRLQSVAFGVITVWLAWRLGRAGWGAAVGIAAALGLAVNSLHGHYSHLAHPVTAMTAFVTLGLWAAVRLANGGSTRHLVVAAVATGLGTACQYHAALLAVPVAMAIGLRAREARGAERWTWVVRGVAAGAGAVLVFLAICPYALLDFAAFRGDLGWIAHKAAGAKPVGPVAGLAAFARQCLSPALGPALAVAAAAGVLVAGWIRNRADAVLLVFVLGYLGIASRAGELNDRYAIPLVVPALVLTARAFFWAATRAGSLRRRAAWAVPLATLAVCAGPALDLVRTDFTMTRGDTRLDALRWFEANVPADERVVIDMSRFWNSASPPLAENRQRLTERMSEIAAGVTGGGHSGVYAEFFRRRLARPHVPAYYLISTHMGDSVRTLDAYRADGFRWAVVSEQAAELQRARARDGDSTGLAYYRSLEQGAPLVAEFRPRPWRRMGPVIRVYRLDPPHEATR